MHDPPISQLSVFEDDTEKSTVDKRAANQVHSFRDTDESNSQENNPGSAGTAHTTEPKSAIDEKRLIRRLDFTLIPCLCVFDLLNFLEKASIGNARLYGMEDYLHISDAQYLIALSMYLVPYALFKVPSNICVRYFRPSIWLPTIMLLWGIVTTCHGVLENFGGLLALRILLGVFEAGVSPAVAYYLTCWYKRDEIGLRLAIFSGTVTSAGAFGGLLAAAISNMDGIGGKGAWAWIFLLEGLVTVVVAIASYFLIQDFPETARFLTEHERQFVIRRLQTDDQFSAGGEKLQWRNVRKSLVDYKTWLAAMAVIGSCSLGPSNTFSYFLPTIISELGYTATRANLLSVPVYAAASICACIMGYLGDRLRKRGYISISLHVITGIGYIILLCSRQPALSYFATFIAGLGIFPGGPNIQAWVSNNVEGSYKRSVSIALITVCKDFLGIISINAYRRRNAPWYTAGHAVTLGYVVIGFIGSVALCILLRKENARRDRGERDEVIGDSDKISGLVSNGCYESVEAAKRDKGDEWSGFRYIT